MSELGIPILNTWQTLTVVIVGSLLIVFTVIFAIFGFAAFVVKLKNGRQWYSFEVTNNQRDKEDDKPQNDKQ